MNLKDDKQQNIQMQLDFSSVPTGEAREAGREETESAGAMNGTENPASTKRLMEEVCERENLKAALRRGKGNKGSPGVDGMTVIGIKDYLKQHWPAIREQLLSGTYEPKPARRVEIAKPDGGVRKLGIPTVLDRFIQQAVMQVLQRRWDRTFSDYSYEFRPGRSAQQAVAQAQQYIAEGHGWCVDLDLEKFFDRVNHDKLMGQIAKRGMPPLPYNVRKPSDPGGTTVAFSEYARAVPGMPHAEAGTTKLRDPPAPMIGPPSGPSARRVSSTRHGVAA